MEWYRVDEPNTPWKEIPVADGDWTHVLDELQRRFRYLDFIDGVNNRTWFQMAPPPNELDCTKFDCSGGGQHEWSTEPASVTSRTGPVNQCKKCGHFEEEIRGDLEGRLFRSSGLRARGPRIGSHPRF